MWLNLLKKENNCLNPTVIWIRDLHIKHKDFSVLASMEREKKRIKQMKKMSNYWRLSWFTEVVFSDIPAPAQRIWSFFRQKITKLQIDIKLCFVLCVNVLTLCMHTLFFWAAWNILCVLIYQCLLLGIMEA